MYSIYRRKLRAFTLVELIAVVAIMGILAVLLIPKMVDYRHDAQTADALANAVMLQGGFERAKLGGFINEASSSDSIITYLEAYDFVDYSPSDVVISGSWPGYTFIANPQYIGYEP